MWARVWVSDAMRCDAAFLCCFGQGFAFGIAFGFAFGLAAIVRGPG